MSGESKVKFSQKEMNGGDGLGRSADSNESFVASKDTVSIALKLKTYDLLHQPNGVEHNTENYNSSDLIVRRGQPFKIQMTFNRDVMKEDKLLFVAETGPQPSESNKSRAVFSLGSSKGKSSWTAVKDSKSNNGLVVSISSPANAIIGHYKLSVQFTSTKGKTSSFKLDGFILLFNPWAPDDDVFLDDEEGRQEYVLNDNGLIFFGQEDFILDQAWNYGQFEKNILNICLAVLDRNLNYKEDPVKDCSRRNDPVYVGRVVSTMLNHYDDDGVVFGRWKGSFYGGVSPGSWSGSVDILNRWKRGGYKPVKYGQCWVFGGVACTVLRCLGIPTRVVTNFQSAHDTNCNLAVEQYFDSEGHLVGEEADSIWNYHVWNESWFVRNDLGSKSTYSGWQVIDSTPQEKSTGIYRCGPASVAAIKEGEVDLDYESPFIFAEVNADRETYICYDDDLKEKVYCDTKTIGQKISTKAIGSDKRVEITKSYKYPEGSEEERAVFQKAREKLLKMGVLGQKDSEKKKTRRARRRSGRRNVDGRSEDADRSEPKRPPIAGKFKLSERPLVSEDVNVTLILTNLSSTPKTVQVNLSSSTIKYTGQPTAEILRDSHTVNLLSNGEERIPVNITPADYEYDLTGDNMIEVAAVCEVKNGGKMLVRKHIYLGQPSLYIEVLGEVVVNEPVQVEVTFTNPKPVWVKDACLLVEGSGLVEGQLRKRVPLLEPRETASIQFEITPTRIGHRQLQVNFTSKKFSEIKAFQNIDVVEA